MGYLYIDRLSNVEYQLSIIACDHRTTLQYIPNYRVH